MRNKLLLKVVNLEKNYQSNDDEIKAIKNINFEIEKGKFISIVGPSGCGKSTLLSILAKLDKLSNGEILWFKDDIRIGYMLQKDSLFPWLTILDNCLLGLKIRKELTLENKNYVIKLLKTYGLGDFIYKYPSSLSGGMRQRAALIRTLAIKPDILLLDEPFSSLDAMTRVMLSDDVYKMIKDEKKTAIMVTHDIGEAVSMADEVIVLSKRPSVVKKIYNLEYDKDLMPFKRRRSLLFNKYYEMIWSDLDVKL